jgi:hypothetical protein
LAITDSGVPKIDLISWCDSESGIISIFPDRDNSIIAIRELGEILLLSLVAESHILKIDECKCELPPTIKQSRTIKRVSNAQRNVICSIERKASTAPFSASSIPKDRWLMLLKSEEDSGGFVPGRPVDSRLEVVNAKLADSGKRKKLIVVNRSPILFGRDSDRLDGLNKIRVACWSHGFICLFDSTRPCIEQLLVVRFGGIHGYKHVTVDGSLFGVCATSGDVQIFGSKGMYRITEDARQVDELWRAGGLLDEKLSLDGSELEKVIGEMKLQRDELRALDGFWKELSAKRYFSPRISRFFDVEEIEKFCKDQRKPVECEAQIAIEPVPAGSVAGGGDVGEAESPEKRIWNVVGRVVDSDGCNDLKCLIEDMIDKNVLEEFIQVLLTAVGDLSVKAWREKLEWRSEIEEIRGNLYGRLGSLRLEELQ